MLSLGQVSVPKIYTDCVISQAIIILVVHVGAQIYTYLHKKTAEGQHFSSDKCSKHFYLLLL